MSHKALPQLDASQRAFCESKADYIRLLAPAGCGKTLALAHRCLHLLQRDPDKKPRFLVVTFTRAARDELRSRLKSESIFEPLLGCVDVVTLNQWGYRRLRSFDRSPRLLTNHNDFHFGMMNDLKPVWEKHPKIRCVVETNKGKSPRKLFELLDGFKAIGFDHDKDSNFEKFLSRVDSFQKQGLTRTWVRLLEPLKELGVVERELDSPEVSYCPKLLKLVYNDFFRFWRESVWHLASMSKFTLEDQNIEHTFSSQSSYVRKNS